jgi:hypothetical protein
MNSPGTWFLLPIYFDVERLDQWGTTGVLGKGALLSQENSPCPPDAVFEFALD